MRSLILLVFITIPAFAQLDSQWFAEDHGAYVNSDYQCWKPGNDTQDASGLHITGKSETVTCGDSTHALSTFDYTSGRVFTNKFNFRYGVVQFSLTTPAGSVHSGVWPFVGLFGVGLTPSTGGNNFQGTERVGPGGVPGGTINCTWPNPGCDEIDIYEQFGATSDKAVHMAAGTTTCNITLTANTTYTFRMDWSSGSITTYTNGVADGCVWPNVPSSYMMLMADMEIGGDSGGVGGVTWPQTLTLQYMRVCPVGTVTCDVAHATMFDDEFTSGPFTSLPSVYVSENYSGVGTGDSCPDAFGILNYQQIDWLNDAGRWANGQIGPGTTVYLCGNITTTMTAQGSGTMGSPITFNWQSGAQGSVNVNGQTYINLTNYPTTTVSAGVTASGGVTIH